ncbi:hypothetical protein [Glycomyces buryatensis]|uniref:Uncharacterized protein n=1 Tax=Glycomyces buryatensis TaxID=2570927 RepID=A0A4S8QAC5_9ACTN|nr:hypothetical protein [Glycomyces buryatensis]THV41397.1 hypothetical protein FAB82_11390 [Glycomyces buryatensis]
MGELHTEDCDHMYRYVEAMHELEDASFEELERIFDKVTASLDDAGIPWYEDLLPPLDTGAAHVMLDNNDGGRGVFVYWRPARSEEASAMAAWKAGEWDDPSFDQATSLEQQWARRLSVVLHSAGILNRELKDDMNPYTLEIISVA